MQYINIEAISDVDLEIDALRAASGETRVDLNSGCWFTVAGSKAAEVFSLIMERGRAQFKERTGDTWSESLRRLPLGDRTRPSTGLSLCNWVTRVISCGGT